MTISTEYDIADGRVFENSANGHREYVGITATLGMFFLGFLYLAYKGIWTHAAVVLIAVVCLIAAQESLAPRGELPIALGGIAIVWLGYTFFARRILAASYLRRGWVEVTQQYPRDGRAPVAPDMGDETIATGAPSVADELTKLVSLRDAGHLTTQEFAEQKARLLR